MHRLTVWIATGIAPCVFVLILASPARPVSWPLIAVVAFGYSVSLLVFGGAMEAYPGRLVFLDDNPIWIARAAFIGALVALFGPFPNLLKVALILPMIVAGSLTDSQGPLLGLVIGALAGAGEAVRVANRSGRLGNRVWLVIVIGAAIVGTILFAIYSSVGLSPLGPAFRDPNVTSRALYLQVASRMFAEAPIFGQGIGAFAATGLDTYPHNMFVEVASELGLVGLAALVGWLLVAIRGAAGSPLLISLVVATTVYTLFSGSLASNAEFWTFTAIAAAMTRLPLARLAAPPSIGGVVAAVDPTMQGD